MKLSAVIIAKNAESIIEECLESVSFCDETIVVDGGSVDSTNAIAKKMGARIVKGTRESFAKQREIGLKEAKGEWIFYIDTDERVSATLREQILTIVSSSQTYSAFRIRRQNFYLGNNKWPNVERLERLFQKDKLKGWYGKLHETPQVEGEIGDLSGLLNHYTHQDLSAMLAKTITWSDIEGELRLSSNHPKMVWWRFFRVMITAWWDSYITQQGFRAGTAGIVESMYQGYSMFITYAKLWEMQQKHVA